MSKTVFLRLIADLFLCIAVVNGWWFIALPLSAAAAWRFSVYGEMILAGIAYDALFGMLPGGGISGYAGIISALILLGAIALLKKVIRK